MTEKQKQQLFNFLALGASLLIPLAAFFVFFALYAPAYFLFLVIALMILLVKLVPLRKRLLLKRSEMNLRMEDIAERKNLVEAGIHQEQAAIESFQKKIVNYLELKGFTEKLTDCLYLEDTSKTLSSEVNKIFGDQDTTIILYIFQSKTGELGISSSHKGQIQISLKQKKGDVFDRWVVKTLQPLLIEDTKNDFRFDVDKITLEEARPIRSLISVPLTVGHKALGILRIDSPNKNQFTTEDLRFLMTIGDLSAVAIENAQLYERVEQLAISDGLTGLYLRRYLLDRMPEEISRHLRRKNPMSFLMIDLDHFKKYNDKYGHIAGDIVLRSFGMILRDSFSEPGILLCRYGGEEFCVLLPDCPKEQAQELAEQLREKVSKQVIVLRRQKTRVTISIGVASFPQDAQIKEELIHKADIALYEAKNSGRNRVCVFQDG